MEDRSQETRNFLLESWLEFNDVIEMHPEIKQLLFDPVTGLPTTPLLFPRIRMLIEDRGEVTLLCVNIVRYSKIEEIYGWRVFDDVMREVAAALESIAGTVIRDSDIIAELMVAGNAFVIVVSPPRSSVKIEPGARQLIVQKIEQSVRERLAEKMDAALYKKFGCFVGAATARFDENVRLERLVHDAIDQALAASVSRETVDAEQRKERLREIIDAEQVVTLVHPVVDIRNFEVIGYEALSRGPADSEFERPDKLFRVAYDSDLVLRLERLCRKKALEAAAMLPEGRILFINVEPDSVADPDLHEAVTTNMLTHAAITPDRIVLEITERSAILDFSSFRSTLEYVRALGFKVAVDDAGAGYGSLQCLAELRPEWIKVDISLVRGCDTDPVRAQLITSLVNYSDSIGVKLIAEGIETREELDRLRELGVSYGQGFLFSLPVAPFPSDESLTGLTALR